MSTKIAKKLKSLPSSSGVYIFKNAAGEVIYVGKATSLKDRVGSYFQRRSGYARPIEMFIDQVADVETRRTDTVIEAYILEQGLIKKWQPKYNVDGKDDKSFCYVVITNESFPRLVILRKTDLENVGADLVSARGKKARIRKGQTQGLSLREKQSSRIFGPYTSRKNIETALKILRKIFPYHAKPQKTEKGCLDFQIGLCPGPYAGAISKADYAKNIRGIRMILEGKKKNLIGRMKKEMAAFSDRQEFERAAALRNQIFALQHIQDLALISDGRDAINRVSTDAKMRIEGYDISNISGRSSVASMVVFDNSDGEIGPNRSQYRKFRIKTVTGANDVASMREVLLRRLNNRWPEPDLIVLDGGRGHLNMARQVLKGFQREIPLLAVAKGPTRKKLDRYAFGSVPEISDKLLEQIREEAHRFAITYHKKVRRESFME